MQRRVFVLGTIAAVGSLPALAGAQSTTVNGCAVGIVNGLLQFSPDCPLLSPPGLGFQVPPPSHLMPQTTDTTQPADVTTPDERRDLKRERQRDKKRERGDDQRRRRRQRRSVDDRHNQTQQDRREQRRLDAVIDGCEDFDTYSEAQDYYLSPSYDRVNDPLRLDRDSNGLACDEPKPTPTPAATPITNG